MLKHYETVFILTPVLSQSQVEETVKKFQDFLKENASKIDHYESWGLKKLAYPIDKKKSGYYELLQFHVDEKTASKNIVSDLELQFKRDERVLRFLSVNLDKYALEYAEKRRQKIKSNQ
ncbi:30S ribosomal protein S6 [Bacteroidetes bacterium endosymbiont of Geopemphigus sp.]|uniref:30S ribosomal protein S6 n=1 Tax=Bacteroidetes bacterium endosymbiont of Geopemphigus sp. TaxID=2047937 RepID=UPI000CD2B826|nr:30S ribosomal protein S6 [Bacteroidetes bacterium endosymbiont of Geopemphigus sp.]